MPQHTLDVQVIEQLRDVPDLIPVTRAYYEDWNIGVFNREHMACKNYLSPNRRDFYKILLITRGMGLFTLGINTYYIDVPTILFIHPNQIVSWKNLSTYSGGHYCLFKRRYIDKFPLLRSMIERYPLFNEPDKRVIRLADGASEGINQLFVKMHEEGDAAGHAFREDALQAYIQLIIVEAMKAASYPKPDAVQDEFRHVHQFFQLLEEETSQVNYNQPLRIKTAKEFALQLSVHPNHLNALLKKHTGQNVSTHIRSRLLDESKALLVQTDWSLQDIGYAIGFADQPNFNQFFKKNTGVTPNEFRRYYQR